MHVPRLHGAFIYPSFLGFLKYLLSFETNNALKIAITYFCPTSMLSSGHFKAVDAPWSLFPERTRPNCAGAEASCNSAHVESICPVSGRTPSGYLPGCMYGILTWTIYLGVIITLRPFVTRASDLMTAHDPCLLQSCAKEKSFGIEIALRHFRRGLWNSSNASEHAAIQNNQVSFRFQLCL